MHDLETRYKAVVHYSYFLPSLRQVSKIYKVSKSSLHRWVHQKPTFKKRRSKHEVRLELRKCIERHIKEDPFITMHALAERISQDCGLVRSRQSVGRYVKQSGFTRKVATRVVDYTHDNAKINEFCKSFIDAQFIVSLDEACFYVGDHPKRGWSLKGKRLSIQSGKSLRRTKFTLLMAVSCSGIVGYEILDHNCKKPDFVKFINSLDAPPGSTILLDNVRFHHSKETLDVATSKGFRLLFTPPYSPKMNPIENVFGVLKPLYRRVCPSRPTQGFDYRQAFVCTIDRHVQADFSCFFAHVRAIAAVTIRLILSDPDHVFSGYG